MRRSLFRIAVPAALLLAASLPAWSLPSRMGWTRLDTPNFTLFGNAGERTARKVGTSLERLRSALGQLNPGLKLTSPKPTYIFVFRDDGSFGPYKLVYNGRRMEDIGGYFITRPEANYVAVNGDWKVDRTSIIHHEYLHYILSNNYPSAPVWLHEGMAELYSTFSLGASEARIGEAPLEHGVWLRRNPVMPLDKLFAVDVRSPAYNERSRRGDFYATSWALAHYLVVGSPERRGQTERFLQDLSQGKPWREAFRHFGDEAALQRELQAYARGRLFPVQRVSVEPESALQVTTRPMSWPEALSRLGTLLTSLDPSLFPQAAEHFRAALAEQPDYPAALAGLGVIEELSDRPLEARPYLEKAARLAPDDFVIQYLYGLNLLEPTPGPEELAAARAAFTRAVELSPELGEGWARLAWVRGQEHPMPPEVVRLFETAHRLLPSQLEVAYNLMLAYARTGQREKARELMDRVVAVQADPEQVRQAQRAFVQEGRWHAEELVGKRKLQEAALILEQILPQASPQQRQEVEDRLKEVRRVIAYNHYVDRWNEAIKLMDRLRDDEALKIFEELAATTPDPGQAEHARKMAEKIKRMKEGG